MKTHFITYLHILGENMRITVSLRYYLLDTLLDETLLLPQREVGGSGPGADDGLDGVAGDLPHPDSGGQDLDAGPDQVHGGVGVLTRPG